MPLTLRLIPRLRSRRNQIAPRELAQVIADLRGFAPTEQDFLHVGERLQQIVAAAADQRRSVADLCESAVAEASSEVLAQVSHWTGELGTSAEARFEHLAPVVRAVRDPLNAMEHALRALRVMAVLARVESARLGPAGAGFTALSAEIVSLADEIRKKSAAILDAVRALSALLARTQTAVAEINGRSQATVRDTAAECSRGLDQMQAGARRVGETVALTGERYSALAAEVGNIVAALQCHDKTRQRIEHVIEALQMPGVSVHVIELQLLQLEEARREFAGAAQSIRADLDRLAQNIADCKNMARDLLAADDDSHSGSVSFRLDAIAASVEELAGSRRAVAAAVSDVRHACARIGGFVAGIEAISVSMLRLALNAEVQAVHLAAAGVVMEAVAEGIRTATESASQSAAAAGEALLSVESIARKLDQAGDGDSGAQAGQTLASRIRQWKNELETRSHEGSSLLGSIARQSDRIASEIASVGSAISADRVLDQIAGLSSATLQAIAAKHGRKHASRISDHARRGLEATVNYTTHSERAVHADFLGLDCPAPNPTLGENVASNVELF